MGFWSLVGKGVAWLWRHPKAASAGAKVGVGLVKKIRKDDDTGASDREAPTPPPVDRRQTVLTTGAPVTADHREIDPSTGQQRGYVVLSDAERAKGFVRPLRDSYRHVGPPGPQYRLRDLIASEVSAYADEGYVKFEVYPPGDGPMGRYWTQAELDAIGRGCGAVTTMALAIAETYARDPTFYSGTFCATCRNHFPLDQFVWDGSDERLGS